MAEKPTPPQFQNPAHTSLSDYLSIASEKGTLPPTKPDASSNLLVYLWKTFPLFNLLIEALWSAFIVVISYLVSSDQPSTKSLSTLTDDFWRSKVNIPPSVIFGVGWCLFVLLSFYIREASNRFYDAQETIYKIGSMLHRIIRLVKQCYPKGTWHTGDIDRIISHLIAYPLALKMTLRGEKDLSILQRVLHPDDAKDVLNAPQMHVHCLRVVRTYISIAEDDGEDFKLTTPDRTPPGTSVRRNFSNMIDTTELAAFSVTCIAEFTPAPAYVNHLRIFLYIWMMFLPFALVNISGWFTVLWSVLFSYVVSMLFFIAKALGGPFGFDEEDIKLNRLCGDIAYKLLIAGFGTAIEIPDVIDGEHDTPNWLELVQPHVPDSERGPSSSTRVTSFVKYVSSRFRLPVIIGLIIHTTWSAAIIFLTWIFRHDNPKPATRWWALYIPLTSSTARYVSLCVFLLLGFWLTDAYARYWRALTLWQAELKPRVTHLAFQICTFATRGLWHERDRERILSHLTALPIALKLHVRGSRDMSDFYEILSPADIQSTENAPDMPTRVMDVIQGYIADADRRLLYLNKGIGYTIGSALVMTQGNLPVLEDVLSECAAIKRFPLPRAFSIHLQLTISFWLAMLPATLVIYNGFLSFLYLIPIAFSMLNLLVIGFDLSDPFGDDADDLPIDDFCNEIRASIYRIYHETTPSCTETESAQTWGSPFIVESSYDRRALSPSANAPDSNNEIVSSSATHATFQKSIRKIMKCLPRVPHIPFLIAVLWMVGAVFASWGLSRLWDDTRQDDCEWWCSPIDVPGDVLGNIGFALFMILAFRASDALTRYDDGAKILCNIGLYSRNLAIEIVQSFPDGAFHEKDKERLVAHAAQIPLAFRDTLLEDERRRASDKSKLEEMSTLLGQHVDGVLSVDDKGRYYASASPMEYLLKTIESYFLTANVPARRHEPKSVTDTIVSFAVVFTVMQRTQEIRGLLSKALSVKRFSVVKGYRRHQHVFAALWMALLPFAMTPHTGFYTILWASLIAYAVLGMEEIAIRLVDPFGTDAVDLPVAKVCERAAADVLEEVHDAGWEIDEHIHSSPADAKVARLGAVIRKSSVFSAYKLATPIPDRNVSSTPQNSSSVNVNTNLDFAGPRQEREVPSLYAHFIKSVPWWELVAIAVWTAVAVVISFVTRSHDTTKAKRWWDSTISLSTKVAGYVSIATFAMLGFYVRMAFKRYRIAYAMWTDELRGACHVLINQLLSFWPVGAIHGEDDHSRLIGHMASLPLALRAELTDSRDVRDARGLLSAEDYTKMQCATYMSSYCINVIRAYYYKAMARRDTLPTNEVTSKRLNTSLRPDVVALDRVVQAAKSLKKFDISPAFIALLNSLLILWFLVLPFALAERSGWFTILWVVIISYGVVGVYSVARELQNPFGTDLNDLDLDSLANEVTVDVLQTYRTQMKGFDSLVLEREKLSSSETIVDSGVENVKDELEKGKTPPPQPIERSGNMLNGEDNTRLENLRIGLKLARDAVPVSLLIGIASWSGLLIALAYVINREFPQAKEEHCDLWFCSAIAVDEGVKEYIGFALFLLLGFRLTDSHNRYVDALKIWQKSVLGMTQVLSCRFFSLYESETWHRGDLERIGGHLMGYATCLMGKLRDLKYRDRLNQLLNTEDVEDVLRMQHPDERCIDVLVGYLLKSDKMKDKKMRVTCNGNDLTRMVLETNTLRKTRIQCKVIKYVQMPFGYVCHLRILLFVWLLLLPLGLVEAAGWLSILWIVIIAYGVIGVESWAEKLCDPFGFDVSDVPLEKLCDRVNDVVRDEMRLFSEGVRAVIHSDRIPFQN